MSLHTLDPEIARIVGSNAAIIYQNIVFWTQKNMANGRHIMDGYVWTYNSRRAFCDLFVYMTESQIKTALSRLVDEGLIVKGEYNKANYDRTNWYAPTISKDWLSPIGHQSPMDWSPIANGLATNHQPIPDSKPDIKHTTLLGAGVNMDDLSQRLCEAAGIADETKAPGLLNISEPLNWIENGCDLDKDIIPAIRSVAARGKRPTAWGYYSRAVFEAKQRREAPPPAVTVEGYTPKQKRETLTERVARLAAAK